MTFEEASTVAWCFQGWFEPEDICALEGATHDLNSKFPEFKWSVTTEDPHITVEEK